MAGSPSTKSKTVKTKEQKEVVKEELQTKQEVKTPKKSVKIERDTLVTCFNVTSGSLNYISKKTGLETVWSEYGDQETLEFAELLTMKSSQPKFLKEPWIFIDDEEVVNQLGLKEIYKNIIPIDEIDDFFKLNAKEAKKILPKLPKGMKELIGDKARKGIQNGELNNIQLVRLLETELHLDLISLME